MSKNLPLCLVLLAASGAASAQYKVLHNFGSVPGDTTDPRTSSVLSQSRGGNIFSSAGDEWTDNIGSAYRITPSGTVTVVHRFGDAGGVHPHGGLTLATDGQYYGASERGGKYGFGTIFRMKQGGGLTQLHSFDGSSGCSGPQAPPIESVEGDFYGTAGGQGFKSGCVYRITKAGTFTVLHTFTGTDGGWPVAPLMQGSDFYFYGTTHSGGTHGYGTLFRISSTGDFKVLFNFDGTHGATPSAPVIQANDGNYYGTTTGGGLYGGGVVFEMVPGQPVTVLHNFNPSTEGYNPVEALTEATDGNFYSTTCFGSDYGTLFRMTHAGAVTVLHNFSWNTGACPQATILQHTNGILYGTTPIGGVNNGGDGTFYSMDLGLPPFVAYLPTYGRAGALVQILGQGFTSASQVFFNGTPAASPVVVYPTYLRVVVPSGATTGSITVTTTSGTLTSNKLFIVHPN